MSNAERVVISPRMNSVDTIVLVGGFLFSVIIMGFAMWTKQVSAALIFGLIGLCSLGNICWELLRMHRFAVVLEKDIVRIRPIHGAERVYPRTSVRWRIAVRLRKGVEEIRLYGAEGDERLASVRTNWPNAGALLTLEHYGGEELTPEEKYIAARLRHEHEERHYLTMSPSKLKALQDGELFEAVLIRTESKVDQAGYFLDGIRALSHEEQVFYIASYYETEVNNGGLCQYFVNSSRETAPFLAECLTEIGAEDHRKLFVDFVTDNRIELDDLSSFMIDDINEFEEQEARYPFDAFDNAFFAIKPIQEYLTEYIRLNINAF